jgi:hypothetical protein
MRESCEYGSVRGARGNSRPYRVRGFGARRLLHLLMTGIGTKCECRDVRYSAALGGLAEVARPTY